MSRKQLSSREASLIRGRPDPEPAHCEPASILYWNPCQGIPPVAIDAPWAFFAAHAIVGALGLAVFAVFLLVFEV
jgi:hypothetical protein